MNLIRNLTEQLRSLWTQAPAAQRAALITAGLLLAAAVVGVGIWSARPQYVMLANGLAPSEAAELSSQLDAKSIKYQVSFSGSTIHVPKSSYKDARLAAGDLIAPHQAAPTPLGISIVDDPSLNGYRIDRRLEESLARTVMKFDGVETATVHLGQPPDSPFAMHQKEATASVVIQVRPRTAFSARQAAAIVATVAQGVPGLSPKNVTLSDTQGRILSDGSPSGGAHIAGQLEYRQQVEADLAANAQLLLSQLVGFGNAVVRVTADIDFNSRTSEETNYDPDRKVRKTETINTLETRGAPPSEGPAGATPNLMAGSGGGAKDKPITKSEEINTTYENAKTLDTIYEAAGKIKRLTVAAVVDLDELAQGDNPVEVTPEKLEGIIKQAVGFDPNRDDELELLIAPLAGAPTEAPPVPVAPWKDYEALLRTASLGTAALVALLLGTLILRKMQFATPASEPSAAPLDAKRVRMVASMSDAARQQPEQLRAALQQWLAEEHEPPAREAA